MVYIMAGFINIIESSGTRTNHSFGRAIEWFVSTFRRVAITIPGFSVRYSIVATGDVAAKGELGLNTQI
jgi:hypothetical protein